MYANLLCRYHNGISGFICPVPLVRYTLTSSGIEPSLSMYVFMIRYGKLSWNEKLSGRKLSILAFGHNMRFTVPSPKYLSFC